jgi:tRNA threonylcarbamoyladenosine biosynthesis protein TsaE
MYRLRDERELFDIGWEDYLDRGGVCALEWSERVEAALGPDTLRVYLRSLGDDRREILIRTGGEASV